MCFSDDLIEARSKMKKAENTDRLETTTAMESGGNNEGGGAAAAGDTASTRKKKSMRKKSLPNKLIHDEDSDQAEVDDLSEVLDMSTRKSTVEPTVSMW